MKSEIGVLKRELGCGTKKKGNRKVKGELLYVIQIVEHAIERAVPWNRIK